MQTLWTRVAQVRGSCRCPQCVSSVHGVSRRAAASATRRMPRYWTTSTVWLSGIFAVATTFDAGVKVQRREKWDLAIAEVKQELDQYSEAEKRLEAKIAEKSESRSNVTILDGVAFVQALKTGKSDKTWKQKRLEYNGEADVAMTRTSAESTATQVATVVLEGEAALCNLEQNKQPARRQKKSLDGREHTPTTNETQHLARKVPRADQVGPNNTALFEGEETFGELEANLDSSWRRSRVPTFPANTGPKLEVRRLPPQSIYSPESYKRRDEGTRWWAPKVERSQLSLDIIQLKLFIYLQRLGWSKEAADAVPASYAEWMSLPKASYVTMIRQKFSDLKSCQEASRSEHWELYRRSTNDIPLCAYHQDDLGEYHDTAHRLNTSLQRLFKLGENKSLSVPAVVAKAYYNLSASSAPPNVDTYNTLILGLHNLGQTKLVRDVIRSFRATRIRPNEVSLAAILNFHTDVGDVEGFRHWIQLMRGQHSGLMFAREGTAITRASEGRLIPNAHEAGFIIQLPYPTPMVFSALIRGVLAFSGFSDALRICEGMSQEGWGLCMSGFSPLLKDCAARGDWTSGLAIWKQIETLKKRGRKKVKGRWTDDTIKLHTYASMLRLCTRCNERESFEQIMNEAERAHPRALKRLMYMIKKEDRVHQERVDAERELSEHEHVVENNQQAPALETGKGIGGTPVTDGVMGYNPMSWTLETESLAATSNHAEPNDPSNDTLTITQSASAQIPVVPSRPLTVTLQEQPLTLEQLRGTLPGSTPLNDYEERERPTALRL